jgi:hypothetical protein
MDFAEQERRPEQIVVPEYQSFPTEGSEADSMFSGNGVDYSKVPKALQGSPLFGSLAAPPQEKEQGQSNADAPVAKSSERSDSAPSGRAVAPPILMAGGLGGALPAPTPNPLQGAAKAFGRGAAAFGRGAAALGRLGVVGGLGAAIWGGPLARPAGGAKEVEWERRNAERMRQQQVLHSTSDGKAEDDASAKKKRKKKQTKQSGKESASDIPSWAKGQRPREGESGNDFAERLLNEKYGKGNYKKGPNSEYNQLRKNGDRRRQ